jgi:hypothetical protein
MFGSMTKCVEFSGSLERVLDRCASGESLVLGFWTVCYCPSKSDQPMTNDQKPVSRPSRCRSAQDAVGVFSQLEQKAVL